MDSTVKALIMYAIKSGAIDLKTGRVDAQRLTGSYTIDNKGGLAKNEDDTANNRDGSGNE